MADSYYKVSYHVPKEYAEKFEIMLSDDEQCAVVIEDYGDINDAVHGDTDALPDDYRAFANIVRFSFFFETLNAADDCVVRFTERVHDTHGMCVRETVSTTLFPLTVDIGTRFTVVYPESETTISNNKIQLKLTTSQIFGTGTHPTTRLMIDMMEDEMFEKKTVVDAGAGSLILSLAALKLGAQHVVAFDIADNFHVVAEDVCRMNEVTALTAVQGDQHVFAAHRFEWEKADVYLVNMLPQETAAVLEVLAPIAKNGAIFLFSGFITAKEEDYTSLFTRHCLVITRREEQSGWIAYRAEKRV